LDYLGLGERILLKRIVCGIMLMLILGSIFFSAIMLVRSDIVEHDLVVFWNEPIVNERNHLRNGTSTVLNMTVFNNGSSVEDVILQLLINGTYVLNSSMPNLAPGHVFWSTYFWVPEEGDYYLTAYAPPVENETHTANNNDTKWVRVCPDKSPIASFTFEPEIEPNIIFVDKNVTFDASASNDDLDWGTIVRYEWDWNDTTTNTTTEPIINHTFTSGVFRVNLTVTDDDGETWWIIYYVPTVNVTLDVKPCQGAFNETAGLYETAGRLPINVTVTNNGEFTETFTVTVYANDTTIGNRTVTIPAGGSENIDFSLDTSVFQKGNYSISAHAPGNITYADYLVGVYLTGDVDHNGAVNIYDVVKITGIYGSELGDPEFTYNTDLDCNGKIQIYDVVICTGHYGQEDP